MPNPEKQPKKIGFVMEAGIGSHLIPMFQFASLQSMERDEARFFALRYMREHFKHCVLFVRVDGLHESWTMGDLEAWIQGGPKCYNEPERKGKPSLPREIIEAWAQERMELVTLGSNNIWEKTWMLEPEHQLTKLRIMMHDKGAWVIILACCASYGAEESHWKGVNLGDVKSIEQLNSYYNAMKSGVL